MNAISQEGTFYGIYPTTTVLYFDGNMVLGSYVRPSPISIVQDQ